MKIIQVKLPNDPPEFDFKFENTKDGVKIKVTHNIRIAKLSNE